MQSEDNCKDWYEGEEMQFTIEQMTGSTLRGMPNVSAQQIH